MRDYTSRMLEQGSRWQQNVRKAEPVFGCTMDMLTARNFPETFNKYIDLLCKLVVNLPDFRNPLTGRAM